jgi:thioredoxin reductase
MTSYVDVAVIGAGPYGLSVAAHLRARGIDHRIFGDPMSAWRDHMPPGMHLKSDGSSSDLSDLGGEFRLADFCADNGVEHDPLLIPVPLANFLAYGLAFQARFAPWVEAKRLVHLNRGSGALMLQFDDGEAVLARHVVVAVGVLPFRHVPANLMHLPREMASHSSAYGLLNRLAGREVTVLGAGSSALDLAALLHEQGARVTLVARPTQLEFHGSPHKKKSLRRRVMHYRPSSKIGGGWLLRLCDDAPQLIRLLPERQRLELVRRTLGPSGGYFIKDRVLGQLAVKCGRSVKGAGVADGRVRLAAVGPDGSHEVIESDHLVMATGYRVDLGRLGFLDKDVLCRLRLAEGAPVLSADYETSVPGLHFVGLASANSFGPVMRFVAGAVHPAHRLGRHLAKALLRRPVSVPALAPAE